MTGSDDAAAVAAGLTKREARRWIQAHWAAIIRHSDMNWPDFHCDAVADVWDDECRKIANRLTRTHLQENPDA